MRAHGMDGELSVSRLNQVCVHTKDRIAWLDQPKVIAMGTDDRVAKLALMISSEQRSIDFTPAGGGSSAADGAAKPDVAAGKARKAAALEAARLSGFLDVAADASACYRADDAMGAIRILFCGRSSTRPDDKPNTLAKKILYQRQDPFDLGAEYGWMAQLPRKVPMYLGREVAASWVADDLGDEADFKSLSLDEAWEALSADGKTWGSKLDIVNMVLLPLTRASHGQRVQPQPTADRHRDPLLNQHIPGLLSTIMGAIGEQSSGVGSLPREMRKSMRFVSVHAGYVEGTSSLITAQAALWAGLLSEAGSAVDQCRFSADPRAEPVERVLLDEADSAAQAEFKSAKLAFIEEASRRKHGMAKSVEQPLNGCRAMAAALGEISTTSRASTAEADAAKARQRAESAVRAARAYKQGVIDVGADRLSFDQVEYHRRMIENGCPGLCPRYVIWRVRSGDSEKLHSGCNVDGCTLSHEGDVPREFRLSTARVDPAYYEGKQTSGKGKGGRGRGEGGRGGRGPRRTDPDPKRPRQQ